MKLKKLILAGFKSFADRTEFEFDDGISCVVGPNGCGKSNIVDAVKWVLGEQSAKSLRGSEMMDVIFNGSATRKAAGSAEVTLVFDNSSGILSGAAEFKDGASDVVSVTRRLYRSSQSDYLINKTQCRLKDIREMFMDTGIGRDAYSLIEQGRVEVFLQASREDRRAIFDEAAGISKYKARRAETLRKLDRVEQNLLRLTDIIGEVAKRLRSIKYQAGKARSYQVHTERLKELRLLYFLAQYHKFSARRVELQGKLDAGNDALAVVNAIIDKLEAAGSTAEVEAVDLERTARELQTAAADIGGKIITFEQRADMLTTRAKELGELIVGIASRCEEIEAEIETCQTNISDRTDRLKQIEERLDSLSQRRQDVCGEHASAEKAVAGLQARLKDEKAGTIDLLRRTAQLHNEVQAHGIRRENLNSQRLRLTGRSEEITRSIEQTLTERARAETKLQDVREVLSALQARLEETRRDARRLTGDEQDLNRRLAQARERRSAVLSRIETLREMLDRLEGIGAGVRSVLQARQSGAIQGIRGMLGDFLQTGLDNAAVVEAALAGADQRLLAIRFDELTASAGKINEIIGENGSVEIMCCDRQAAWRTDFDVSTCPQVTGRVIDLVSFEAWVAPVVWRILGRTLVVRSLGDAVAAAKSVPAGFRFVTLAGEVLEADGTIRFGAARRATGVITRRSELAELARQEQQLQRNIDQLQQRCRKVRSEYEHLDQIEQSLRTAIYEANTEQVEAEGRLSQLNGQIDTLRSEQPVVASDLDSLAAEIDTIVRAEHEARDKAAELDQLNTRREQEIDRLERLIATGCEQQDALAGKMTEVKVALAASEEKKLACRGALAAQTRRLEQMQRDLSTGRMEIETSRRRRTETEAEIQNAREEVDRLYDRQKEIDRDVSDVEESRAGLREKLENIRHQLGEKRRAREEAAEQVNAGRIELSEADVRIENLITRASDDMNMDLLERHKGYEHDEDRDWPAVEAEIDELRGKIERLGNVNLDAISEQDELQQRHEFLSAQLDDVRGSQKQLTELIRRINRQSREMFLQAFETIRKNFQELFRKLFGGGRADIMLTDPQNVLESGIEVFARPPGKELRSLSLLSGGEKTMTALAMMFSIFKSRPSPFCLLDEVDAALDETNNERFNTMLRDFVQTSQFLIISHAKRTMSMANVLYGVTMQEPGVSKRISVRFEDVGHKLDEQLKPVGV